MAIDLIKYIKVISNCIRDRPQILLLISSEFKGLNFYGPGIKELIRLTLRNIRSETWKRSLKPIYPAHF